MDRFNRKSFTLGEDTFFVQLIPPKESIKAWTEVQKMAEALGILDDADELRRVFFTSHVHNKCEI